jgi:hypothetical protein
MRRIITALAGAALLATMAAAPVAAQERIAPPPSSDALVGATNAMLRPADLPAPVRKAISRSGRFFFTGFFNPPGGQDPMPICVSGPNYTTVSIPRDNAVGYMSSYGGVSQYEYEYPSAAAAAKVWRKLSGQVAQGCTTTFTEGDQQTANSARRIPGVRGGERGWQVSSFGAQNDFSSVQLIGDTIQQVNFVDGERPVSVKVQKAMGALAAELADRWADRSQASVVQDSTLTKAERTMVQPADVPAGLPMATAADGGWSSFQSSVPGMGPDSSCRAQAKLPTGTATFTTVLFSGGDVFGITGKGSVVQQVEVYGSADEAKAAWQAVTAELATCSLNPDAAIPAKKPFTRTTNGTSSVVVGGVTGVWTASLDTFPTTGKGFTNGAYTVSLLVGDSIQQVTYSLTRKGVGEVTVDRAAVEALASSLAQRWIAYAG